MPGWVKITIEIVKELGFPIAISLILLYGVIKKLIVMELQNQKICTILEAANEMQKEMVEKLLNMVDRKIG